MFAALIKKSYVEATAELGLGVEEQAFNDLCTPSKLRIADRLDSACLVSNAAAISSATPSIFSGVTVIIGYSYLAVTAVNLVIELTVGILPKQVRSHGWRGGAL